MIKQAVKLLWNSGAMVFWTACLFLGLTYIIGASLGDACSNDEIDELYSPDREYRAIVKMSGCGGFSSPQTHILVERVKNRSISPFTLNETDVLIRLDGRPDKVNFKLRWKANDEFIISDVNSREVLEFSKKSWGTNLPRVRFEFSNS